MQNSTVVMETCVFDQYDVFVLRVLGFGGKYVTLNKVRLYKLVFSGVNILIILIFARAPVSSTRCC